MRELEVTNTNTFAVESLRVSVPSKTSWCARGGRVELAITGGNLVRKAE